MDTTLDDLGRLARLIRKNRDELLARWRVQVRALPSAADLDTPSLDDHLPTVLTQIVTALEHCFDEPIAETIGDDTQSEHGEQRYAEHFDIEEIVAEYNILRGCIHDLVEEQEFGLRGKAFHIVNRVLDSAIGSAVKCYAELRAKEVRKRREEHLAFVAHDLRTPLSAIALAAAALEERVTVGNPLGQPTHDLVMLKILRRNVQHLETLVGSVLTGADAPAEGTITVVKRTFDLWPLTQSVLFELQQLAHRGGTRLDNQVEHDTAVHADAGLLKRILQNLVANAIAYAPGGKVVVAARELDGGVELRVEDDGLGIPNERLARLFERVEPDPEQEGSLGLGLSIVHAFVEAHAGRVTAESEVGRGTQMRVWLPGRA